MTITIAMTKKNNIAQLICSTYKQEAESAHAMNKYGYRVYVHANVQYILYINNVFRLSSIDRVNYIKLITLAI